MKKKIALILALLLLCLSFTGCTLEGMRAAHLKLDEKGNIAFNGHVYMPLVDERDILNPQMDYEKQYYLTEADVPLLLMDMVGARANVSRDGRFLVVWGSDYYCRSDVYEQVQQLLKNPGDMEYFCYYPMYATKDAPVIIPLENSKWLKQLLSTLEPEESNGIYADTAEYVTQLDACNEDMLLREFVYTVYRSGLSYYLECYNEDRGNYDVYHIPAQDVPQFAAMFVS